LLAIKSSSEDEHIDEVRVTSQKSVGNNLAKLSLRGCLVVALRRDGTLIAPNGATVLRHNDILTLLGDNKSLERAKRILQVTD
jgi:Trk K+ transport system NAD-binding subunit